MEFNPYQSPSPGAGEPAVPELATRKLRGPTLGLLLLSGMMLAGCLLNLLIAPVIIGVKALTTGTVDYEQLGMAVACFALLIPSAAIFFGAWQARQGKAYRWAMTAAILSCIPIISPLMYFGIPLGIWMFLVLRRKDVRAVFASSVVNALRDDP